MAAYSRGGTGRTDIEIEIFRTSAVNPVGPCRELVYNGPRLRPVREFCYARSECKFWIDSDDWHAVADGLGITVQGGSFEEAKRSMEAALNEYVQSVLRKPHVSSNAAA